MLIAVSKKGTAPTFPECTGENPYPQPFMKSSPARKLERRGFALVVTLSLMILLTVVAVGLLSLSAVSLRSEALGLAEAEARANARLAMILAIGDLQKQLGPDQRISITADQRSQGGDGGESSAAAGSHYWTGVYDSWPATQDARPTPAFRVWLVSGDDEALKQASAADSGVSGSSGIELVGTGTLGTVGNGQVKVAPVTLAKDGTAGVRLAWWVGDQGVKAAIATPPPSQDTSLATVRNNLQAASRNCPAIANANSAHPFAGIKSDDDRVMRVTSWQQAGLLASKPSTAKPLFHDLTAFSTGLLTNVRSGGFRKDLSLKLEQDFSSADLTQSANVLYSVGGEPGINFQELWAYYHLPEQLQYSGGGTYTTGGTLANNTPFLQLAAGTTAAAADNWFFLKQPIVVSYQLVLSLSMRPAPAPNTGQNRLQVDFDPVVTLWNPLDVPVVVPPCPAQDASKYTWYWAGFWQVPYDVNVTINGTTHNCSLMRSVSYNRNSNDNNWISMTVGVGEQLVFKPGEVIRISQTGNTTAQNAVYSPLTGRKGFNYGGGVTFPLIDTSNNPIYLNPTDLITYTATANNLTSGKDGSGGNVIGGGNSRRWSLTTDYFMIGNPYGGTTMGIGQLGLDSCYGYKRPTYVPVSPGTPASNITASNSTRLYANNFPQVFPPIQGQDTRDYEASTIDCSSNPLRKAPFMVFAYDAKTEKDSKLGTRSFAQFNPRAFHVNFFSLSAQERDMLPYEVTVTPMTSWLKAPLDVTPNGNGFHGASGFAEWGSSFVTTHSVPRQALVSLAAFQHSCANGFNFLRPV